MEITSNILEEKIGKQVVKAMQQYDKTSGFTSRKLTDTPTDALSVVNRKFVTGNGSTASRPTSPILGQFFLDTSLSANGKPIWFGPNGWADSTGTLV